MTADRFARIVALLGVAFWLFSGLWAFLSPKSFFDNMATFEPYNEHFLHDLGAFSIGIGVALLLPLVLPRLSTLAVVLSAAAVAALLHVLAHAIDSDLGGKDTDVPGLGFFAILTVAAVAAAWPKRPAES
jgi:uncharacterized membrane protein